jgi:hypothetical protein
MTFCILIITPVNASMIWKCILQSKPLLPLMLVSSISKFSNYPIWTTSWIPTFPFFKPIPRCPYNHDLPSLLISDLIHPDSLKWRSPIICSLFDEASATAILDFKISGNPNPIYTWTPSILGDSPQIQLIYLSSKIICLIFPPNNHPFGKIYGN